MNTAITPQKAIRQRYKDISLYGTTFDSNLLQEDDLQQGQFRLQEVDNRLVLPVNKYIRLLTSAKDVIHNFAVPSLGIN